jgi:hypothetical protein
MSAAPRFTRIAGTVSTDNPSPITDSRAWVCKDIDGRVCGFIHGSRDSALECPTRPTRDGVWTVEEVPDSIYAYASGHRRDEAMNGASRLALVELDIETAQTELDALKREKRLLKQALCVAVDPTNPERAPEYVARSFTKNDTFKDFFRYCDGLKAIGLHGWFRLDEHEPGQLNVIVPRDAVAEIVK